jgi:putative ABC transport system permease protein
MEAGAPLTNVATTDDLMAQSLEAPGSLTWLVAGFAAVALLLSVVGIYGVMAYFVQQNRKDISIRLALGGSAGDVGRHVVRHGMAAVVSGVVVGLVLASATTRLLSTLLFGVSAADLWTFVGVSLVLLGVALIACVVPAHRATGLQPAAVLRDE